MKMILPDYKKLCRFKKRRLLSNVKAAVLSRRSMMTGRAIRPQSCLIMRLDHLGDYLLFRNFLPAIRSSVIFKDWHLTLCANIAYKELAEHLDAKHVNDFIWIDVDKAKKRKDSFFRVANLLHQRGYALAVQPNYSRDIYGDLLMQATAAEQRLGVDGDCVNQNASQRAVTDSFYTRLIKVSATPKFEFERNREIVTKFVQQPVQVEMPSLPKPGGDRLFEDGYAVILPGTSSTFKYWPHLSQIVDHIHFHFGFKIVFLGKGKREQRWIADIMKRSACAGLNLCDQTSLLKAADILYKAHIVVGNDSGLIHMAVLLNTPTVCLSAGTHAFRFNSYPEHYGFKVRFVLPPELEMKKGTPAFATYAAQYATGCDVRSIPVESVKLAIEDVLSRG
ncbi:glycosyltransferase family 9 protein [candidate division KSB1 bacterium]|nr:glycosyltransferase family 9 protein [candidate division KSB1 bacterium]RQW07612.1 MAG: lipopolysaccharide heptosyltransferase family protein [candidate division KSB1 bacterium]